MTTVTLNKMNLSIEEAKDAMVGLLVSCAILPDSKVLGVDMFGQPTGKMGLKGLFEERRAEIMKQLGKKLFLDFMSMVMEEYNDKIQDYLDFENDLHKNEEVDDLAGTFEKYDAERLQFEFNQHISYISSVYGVADEALKRHKRMVMRLAVMEKLKNEGMEDKLELVNDALIERLLNKEGDFDEELKIFIVDPKILAKKETEILRKDQAAHWRERLEDKAILLRDLCFRAEEMQRGRLPMDDHFVQLVIKLANKTKVWCEGRQGRERPYSKRAINALYNEAVHTLVALGKFKTAFVRKEYNSEEECSFFMKPTRQDMVEVKSAQNWADELRTIVYEVDDGCSKVSAHMNND